MITLNHVSKVFTEGEHQIKAVDDVSLNIKEGEIFGIIGYSGAGKSTLVRTLNGLEKLTSGDIYIGEDNLNELSAADLRLKRQKIGMIFQHFNLLWSRTVRENILFSVRNCRCPQKNEQEARVKELIDLVGLTGREEAYPAQLSGGQKTKSRDC